ncbi:MAG: YbaB/EbfC family nucleoid-associated protein [Armatimonadota bacterium]
MGNPFGNIGNLGGMMKQAKKAMEAMQKAQEELAEEKVEATSGGGMVKAVVTGMGEFVEIKINPQVVDAEDVEMLEDLVSSAIREALATANKMKEERMGELTGGLNLPGLF